jgi:hypothetical protein
MTKPNGDQNESTVNLALVLGYIATKDLETIEKKVAVLTQLGYSNAEMLQICGTTNQVIRNVKSKVKKGWSTMANKSKPVISEAAPEVLMLGYLCTKDIENLAEKVNILDRFGLADVDIATICGRAIQSIRNARQLDAKKAKGE